MRQYIVQPGDSPARIASRDDMAGCPKCSIDLVRANPHKLTVTYPNGFVTFQSLRVGEHLNLPEKWFSKEFDQLPPSYFASLPHADGMTPGKGSVQGITPAMPMGVGDYLGDYPELDTATSKVAALGAMDNATFNRSVGDAGAAIDASVQEAYGTTKSAAAAAAAQNVQNGTQWAWQRNQDLTTALANGDAATATQARLDIQNALATALGNARVTLNAFYGPSPDTPGAPPAPAPSGGGGFAPVVVRPPSTFPANVVSAAQAAANAIAADSNYCTSVAQPGSSVNAAIHQFKIAWNATQSAKVPVGTGNYEAATAAALGQVIGSAPTSCGARPTPSPVRPPIPSSPVASTGGGMSTATIAGIGILSAAAVGGAVYMTTRTRSKPTRRQQRR